MNFKYNKNNLQINFSLTERIRIFLKGNFRLERKSTYMFSTHLLRFVSETLSLCGDQKEHGDFTEEDNLKSK